MTPKPKITFDGFESMCLDIVAGAEFCLPDTLDSRTQRKISNDLPEIIQDYLEQFFEVG